MVAGRLPTLILSSPVRAGMTTPLKLRFEILESENSQFENSKFEKSKFKNTELENSKFET